MYIGLVSTCGDYGLANILYVVQRVMLLFQVAVPIIAIVALVYRLTKLMAHPDDAKLKTSIKNWVMSLLFFFFVPVFIDVVVSNTDMIINNSSNSDYSISACWKAAKEHSSLINVDGDGSDDGYIKTDQDKNKQQLVK